MYYALARWEKLTSFLDNGRVEIDNNLINYRIRPIAVGRINYMLAGSYAAQRADILYSLLITCALHGVNPAEWLVEVLKRVSTTAKEARYTSLPHHR